MTILVVNRLILHLARRLVLRLLRSRPALLPVPLALPDLPDHADLWDPRDQEDPKARPDLKVKPDHAEPLDLLVPPDL